MQVIIIKWWIIKLLKTPYFCTSSLETINEIYIASPLCILPLSLCHAVCNTVLYWTALYRTSIAHPEWCMPLSWLLPGPFLYRVSFLPPLISIWVECKWHKLLYRIWYWYLKNGRQGDMRYLWWRHQMERYSASLVLCEGNHRWIPSQRPVTRSFDVIFSNAPEQTVEQTNETLVI